MVFAVQCPEPTCRKYMLVEEHDRGTVVPCLICKTPIRVGGAQPAPQSDRDRRANESGPAYHRPF